MQFWGFGQLGGERLNFWVYSDGLAIGWLWFGMTICGNCEGYVMHHMFNLVFLFIFSSGVQNVWNWSFLEKVLPSGLWLNPTLSVIWILNFFLCFRDRWCVWIIVSYVWIVIFFFNLLSRLTNPPNIKIVQKLITI